MGTILIAGAALAAALFLTKSKPPAATPKKDDVKPLEPKQPPAKKDTSAIPLTIPPVVVAAGASVLAGANLGNTLNGPAGAVVGGLNPFFGNVFNVGAASARLLDKKVFGGTEGSVTSVVAQTGGGLLTLTASLFGVFASVGLATILAPIYAAFVIVSDAERLRRGQAGAKQDYYSAWETTRSNIRNGLLGRLNVFGTALDTSGTPLSKAERAAWPTADGICLQKNRMAFNAWMARRYGLGQTQESHAKYGWDRGYFYGELNGSTLVDPPQRSTEYEYFPLAQVQSHELTTSFIRPVPTGEMRLEQITPFMAIPVPITRPESIADFPERLKFVRLGRIKANIQAYVDWMQNQPVGAFQNDGAHLRAGQEDKGFEGAPQPDGKLIADWFNEETQGFEVKLYDWAEIIRRQGGTPREKKP